jgi:NhaA family Na+:H+ antiporter
MAIKRFIDSLTRFTHNAAFSGVLLIVVSIIALLWANSAVGDLYFGIWENKITIGFGDNMLSKPLLLWINDGLMAMFFFVIGLEIKRELNAGELSSWRKAAMPVFAAIGGMVVPALIYFIFNQGFPSKDGWGIPMATDIAFSLGVLALLGKRVPLSLKIFLTALAIVDDLGAVMVIAFFYTSDIIFSNLMLGAAFLGVMIVMNLAGVRNTLAYAIPGILGIWLAFLLSGVHATIAGVLAAFTIPATARIDRSDFRNQLLSMVDRIPAEKNKKSQYLDTEEQEVVLGLKQTCTYYEPPLQSLERALHPFVLFLIMPIFALSNTGVIIENGLASAVGSPAGLGIVLGLVLGKPIGILLFSWLAKRLGIAAMPEQTTWTQLAGVGLLAGIGFTMSLFFTSLALDDPALVTQAKISILVASFISGLAGYFVLRRTLPSG